MSKSLWTNSTCVRSSIYSRRSQKLSHPVRFLVVALSWSRSFPLHKSFSFVRAYPPQNTPGRLSQRFSNHRSYYKTPRNSMKTTIGEGSSPMASAHDFVPYNKTAWYNLDSELRIQATEKCILPLSSNSYKGSSGRVGVLGGSARYTGAPYYASMAALKVGADLAFCFCAEEASIPIKCYSPELMVAPVYSAKDFDSALDSNSEDEKERLIQEMVDKVSDMMDKLHVLVIGPGLGRCPLVLRATSRIIREAQTRKVPMVLDADALFLFTLDEYHDILTENCESLVVLTPNAMERKRLSAFEDKFKDLQNVVVVEKGAIDRVVVSSTSRVLNCHEAGGWKRSGGIGDILAGTLGTLVAWNTILRKEEQSSERTIEHHQNMAALLCWTACSFVKRATHIAYHQHFRSMTAPDVLEAMGPTVHEMTSS